MNQLKLKTNSVIPVGKAVSIQEALGKERYRSKFLGWNYPNFIIMDTPLINRWPVELYAGQEIIVRYLINGTVCGFRSEVIALIKRPYHILFATFPENFEEMNLRNTHRYEVEIPCELEKEEWKENINGLIVDISASGCAIKISKKEEILSNMKTGESLFISFSLPNKVKIERCKTCIRRIHQTDDILLGLEFDTAEQKNLNHIKQISNVLDAQLT